MKLDESLFEKKTGQPDCVAARCFFTALEAIVIQVVCMECQPFRRQNFGFEIGPYKSLRCHTMPGDEPESGKRSRSQNAHPTQCLHSEMRAQAKIQPHGDAHRQNRKDELAQGQAEKHTFGVSPDLPVDFNFQIDSPSGMNKARQESTSFSAGEN